MVKPFILATSMASLVSALVPLNPQAVPANCEQFLIPITINPMTYNLSQYLPNTDLDLVNFVTELASTPNNITMGAMMQNTASVNISARMCSPTSTNVTAKQNATVQFLIHGIGVGHHALLPAGPR